MGNLIFSNFIFLSGLFYCVYTAAIFIEAGQSEEALSFNFTKFAACDGDEIRCVGDANVSDHVVHLTNSTTSVNFDNPTAGRIVYKKTTIQLSSIADFSTYFRFAMNCSNQSHYGGDGILFFLTSKGNAYVVPQFKSGGWFGFVGDESDEFTPFFGVAFSSMEEVVGIGPKNLSEFDYLKKTAFHGLNNGNIWDAQIDYNSSTEMLQVYIARGFSHKNLILEQSVNLYEYFTGNVVVRFSSAGLYSGETHDIFSWSFNSSLYSDNSLATVSSQKSWKKVIISTVLSGVVACITGALLFWGYFAFVKRKKLASVRRKELADMDLDRI